MEDFAAENKVKITNPDRIDRILRRICQASLQVMIRTNDKSSVAVKGRASGIVSQAGWNGIRITNVSIQGISYLSKTRFVKVEFRGMSTQVTFESQIVLRDASSIIVKVPDTMISIERRKAARFPSVPHLSSYLSMGVWRASPGEHTSPPTYPIFGDMCSWIRVFDISDGGLCAVARFPGVMNKLNKGLIDEHCQLILPMQQPRNLRVELRWYKRIKERIVLDSGERFQRHFRFGIQFIDPDAETKTAIRQYMQSLSLAEAI